MIKPLIHATAILGKELKIGRSVSVGPYSVIEDHVTIGDESAILDHVHIGRNTTIGKKNVIHMGAVIGHEAQHKSAVEIESFLIIGDNNVFREYVTVHRGSEVSSSTKIGNDNYFMAFSHVGHDCHVEDHVTVTNAVLLAGHVSVEDHAILSGGCGVHQFCRIGAYAMIGGLASVTKDVPPYMLVDDNEHLIGSINLVGLRREGFSEEAKRDIKNAYKLLYLSRLNTTQACEAILQKCHTKEVTHLLEFIKQSKRGILGHRKQNHAAAAS